MCLMFNIDADIEKVHIQGNIPFTGFQIGLNFNKHAPYKAVFHLLCITDTELVIKVKQQSTVEHYTLISSHILIDCYENF